MADKNIDTQTVASLGKKLDEFAEVLSPEEHSVLLGLIGMASATMEQAHASVDTEALAVDRHVVSLPTSGKLPSLSLGVKDAFKAMGQATSPGGAVQDSIGVGVSCVSWSKDYSKSLPGSEAMRIPGLTQKL